MHAIAVAWLGTRAWSAPRPPRTDATPTVELVEVEIQPPLVVAAAPPAPEPRPELPAPLPEPAPRIRAAPTTPATPAPPAPPAAALEAPSRAAPAPAPAELTATAPTGAEPPTAKPAVPVSALAMRRGGAPGLALPAGRWDTLDHAPKGTGPERDATTGILSESGGGTRRSDQGSFVGKVNPDGTVKLTDKANLNIHLALPTPRSIGNGLSAWYHGEKGEFGAEGDTSLAKQIQVAAGATTDPQSATRESKDRAVTVIIPVLQGGFDVTDALMRGGGQDPYAAKKLKFLDETRDERVQIGNRHRAEQLARATQHMKKNLDALWAATTDLAARKRALLELWDECVETGDPAAVAAGAAARRLVIGFIRGRLPAGSPDAFTADEIAAFARRKQSKAAFEPYE